MQQGVLGYGAVSRPIPPKGTEQSPDVGYVELRRSVTKVFYHF